jgi:hypothetical protein
MWERVTETIQPPDASPKPRGTGRSASDGGMAYPLSAY